jgi:hypothetical protein
VGGEIDGGLLTQVFANLPKCQHRGGGVGSDAIDDSLHHQLLRVRRVSGEEDVLVGFTNDHRQMTDGVAGSRNEDHVACAGQGVTCGEGPDRWVEEPDVVGLNHLGQRCGKYPPSLPGRPEAARNSESDTRISESGK